MRSGPSARSTVLSALLLLACSGAAVAQRGSAAAPPRTGHHRNLQPPASPFVELGNAALGGALAPGNAFGYSVAPLGDFDGNGVSDLVATSAAGDGSVFLLRLASGGGLLEATEIPAATFGAIGWLYSVDRIGDLDGDGVTELCVGSDDEVFVLFLAADGTLNAAVRIAAGSGGLVGTPSSYFGVSVTRLGDLDGDGVPDVAVGSLYDVLVLFLAPDGTVRAQQQITPGIGGFPPVPPVFPGSSALSLFGWGLDELGDFDGDGVMDLVITGQDWTFEGEIGRFWLVLLNADGTVKSVVGHDTPGLGIWPFDHDCGVWYGDGSFGRSAAGVGDLDRDGVPDIAVSSPYPACCTSRPSVRVLHLLAGGGVKDVQTITEGTAPWGLTLESVEQFGTGLTSPGDLDGDGRRDLVVGSPSRYGTPDEYCEYSDDPLGALRLLFQLP